MMKRIFQLIIITALSGVILAQSVRSLNNSGVDKYEESIFPDAEVNFKKAIEENAETFSAHYNLGSALYKQERYDEAIKSYQNSLSLAESEGQKSQIFYNRGNALLKSQKLQESIESYKEALKINPNDLEAKYNLSYALELLKNQQDQQQNQDQDQQDQNQDQNQDQQQDQNQRDNNQDQDKNDQRQNQQDQQEQDQQNQQQQQQPKKDQISKEEAERILQALKNNEAELQKELRKQKGKQVKTAKDW